MSNTTTLITDDQSLKSVKSEFGRDIRFWDEGFGPLWVYRESLGVVGVVRATNWEDAWACVVDEIMDDADPSDDCNYARDYNEDADEGELAEGVHYRGSGVPSNEGLESPLASEDLNGSALDLLTPEFAAELGLQIEVEDDE